MTNPTARERLTAIELDNAKWSDVGPTNDVEFLTAALRRALDALERLRWLSSTGAPNVAEMALVDIDELARGGK